MHAAAAKQPLTYFTITTQRGWNYGYQDTRTVHTTIQVGQERVAMIRALVSRGARGEAAPLHFEGNKGRTFDLLSFKNFKK